MNILIPHSWLKEYLETAASPEKIGECLSLCGASVEKINKRGKDFVYDIEVTTNRVDMASILGIAREAAAILPQFGIKAKLKKDPYDKKIQNTKYKIKNKLKITLKDNSRLCQRVLGVVLDNVKLGASPKKIQERLEKAGFRSLNNAVDITNYIMTELGHPAHVFDYDRLKNKKLILRRAKKGEKIVSLENKEYTLPGGDVVIDNSQGKIIDLPGIIGTENSIVKPNTKRVLLFTETNDPAQIRKSSMSLGIRTVAASLNEKSVDPELAKLTILKGIELFKQYTEAKVASKIYDIYPQPYRSKQVNISLQLIKHYLGIPIQSNKVIKILDSLGFKTKLDAKRSSLSAEIPSWRAKDINIPEDLIEEIARVYGYHNLPSVLPPLIKQPKKPAINFEWETKAKLMLKNWGLTETYTYSMQSKEEINQFNLNPKKHLKIKNPLSSDWLYMRTNLIPSLLTVIRNNQGYEEKINIFELANIYLPQKNNLPLEYPVLTLALTGDRFYELKGICEALFEELGIEEISFRKPEKEDSRKEFLAYKTSLIFSGKKPLGHLGEINPEITAKFELKNKVTVADLDFDQLLSLATKIKKFAPLPKYPPVIEDLTFIIKAKTNYLQLVEAIKSVSKLIEQVEFVSIYKKQSLTLKITYQDPKKNLTDQEVGKIRKKIVAKVKQKGLGKLKEKD